MKKLLSLLTAGAILIAAMTAFFPAAVSSADEWGRPDVYRSPEYPQSYGGQGSHIERSTLTKDIVLSIRADKDGYDEGAVKFTISLANNGGAVEATSLGITPAYDITVFDPDAPAAGEGWGNLNARILWNTSNGWYNEPFVNLDTRWDARNRMYFMVAAWDRTAPLNIPAMSAATDFFEFSLIPKNTAAAPGVVYVYVQFKNGSSEFARLLSVKVGEGRPSIRTAGISIDENYTVNVSAFVPDKYGAPQMRFQKEGQPPKTILGRKEDGLWKFAFPGIFPQCMGDRLSMELLSGSGEVLDGRTGFTIRDYALSLAGSRPSDAKLLKTVYSMLHFGAEAQKYMSYKTGSLVNDGIPAVPTAEKPSGRYVIKNKDPSCQIISAVLKIDNAFVVKIKTEAAKDPRISFENGAELGFTTVPEEGKTVLYTGNLTLSELGKTLTVVNGSNTLEYSVVAYFSRIWDSAEAGGIVKALYTHYAAAREYASQG